jgi:hypothetical protein
VAPAPPNSAPGSGSAGALLPTAIVGCAVDPGCAAHEVGGGTHAGLDGGYWGSHAAEAGVSAEDAKHARRCRASVPPLTARTRALFGSTQRCLPELLRLAGRQLLQVHSSPNIFTVKNFLTEGEVSHLLELSRKNKKRFSGSKTDTDDGLGSNDVVYRTSKSMHLKKALDSAVRRIEGRAADMVGMPAGNVEGLQLVSYTKGQSFDVHHDIGPIDDACEHVLRVVPPRRIVTLFVYGALISQLARSEFDWELANYLSMRGHE